MYYVYLLQSDAGKLYIGYSSNLKQRIKEHLSKKVTSTKRNNYRLIYYEAYLNKADAVGREIFLKSGSGRRYINKQLTHYFHENSEVSVSTRWDSEAVKHGRL